MIKIKLLTLGSPQFEKLKQVKHKLQAQCFSRIKLIKTLMVQKSK